MKITAKPSQTAFAIIFVAACSYKPFQPPPAMFKVWSKPTTSSQEIISSMKKCGLDEVTGYHENNTVRSTYRGEKCMENLGHELKGSYKGICASEIAQKTAECRDALQSNDK